MDTETSVWLLKQATKLLDVAARSGTDEIAGPLRAMARDFIARAHQEARLQEGRGNDDAAG